MKTYQFNLHLSPEQYLEYYRGTAQTVLVRCDDGLTLQFPASLLQRFVTKDGIAGRFELSCTDQNKCVGLKKLGSD